ncbi:Rpn family recombination-promoting nuclease/putative transposase [Faecalibacillus intestinalis]|uniref:Rpn family recombination-promoting nuclease/putative transposase n=1 Tax=Faecalibacillus intestinalis TaxID=1982626 RepID=UPI003990D825
MILTNKLTPDSACRTFLSNDTHFASLYNAILFDGKQVIHPERLVRYENDTSFIIDDTKSVENKKRRRDIVVKTDINGVYCLLSIEHQSTIDFEMVIRWGIYEMLEYLKQLKNKKNKRLVPQVMIVFYTGDKKWNAPVKLSNYFDIPEELKPYFNDWKIYLVDVKEIDTSKIKDEQTRYFIEAIQEMYKGNYEGLHRKVKMNRDNFIYAAIITGSLDLIRDLPEGDEIDMCEGMERMAEGFRNEGRKEGLMEGEKREKKITLLSQLKVKLGNVSNQLEEAIQNSSIEKLNTLTLSIFDITSEEDVLKIIN